MKILCPTDFSTVSVNAISTLASALTDRSSVSMDLCHFIHYHKRGNMFISLKEILIEKGKEDLTILKEALHEINPNISYNTLIYYSHPKTGVVNIAEENDYDLIVLGSTGLDALKSITIGSMTQYVFDHSQVPVLAIPAEVNQLSFKEPIVAVDLEEKPSSIGIDCMRMIFEQDIDKAKVIYVQETPDYKELTNQPAELLGDIDYRFEQLQGEEVESVLTEYGAEHKNEIVCLFHKKRSWIKRLFERTMAQDKLKQLKSPLLILPY